MRLRLSAAVVAAVVAAAGVVLAGCDGRPRTQSPAQSPAQSPIPAPVQSPAGGHRTGVPFAVDRGGVDALVWVDRGRHDVDGQRVVGDTLQYTVTVEVFGGVWRFGPALIACREGGTRINTRVDVGPAATADIRTGERRYWKISCGHAAGAPPLTVAVYFADGDLLAAW